ncbi:hypothetical protein ACLOJK_024708 [Asimina triloba]
MYSSSSSSIDESSHPSPTSSISNATVITTKQQQQQPPPWEVLLLVSHFLDRKMLAIASCVCKPWSMCMAQDHLWQPICLSRFPSIAHLRHFHPTISYQRLYALARFASKHRRPIPVQPHISFHDLIFLVDVSCRNGRRVLSVGKSGADLLNGSNCATGVWQFDMQVWESDCGGCMEEKVEKEGVKVVWTVVLKDWKAAFFMMEGKGNGKMVGGKEMWFSEELPSPGCCSTAAMSGLVAEVGLEFGGEKRVRVEKVSLGLMCVMSWRYVSVDDGLRYLQHFLLPSAV